MCSTRNSVRVFYIIGNSILGVIVFHFSVLRVKVIWCWLIQYVCTYGFVFYLTLGRMTRHRRTFDKTMYWKLNNIGQCYIEFLQIPFLGSINVVVNT